MNIVPAATLVASILLAVASPARAEPELEKDESATSVEVGGYIQPQVKVQENDAVAQDDENGFRLARSRVTLAADRPLPEAGSCLPLVIGGRLEAELTPELELLDAYLLAFAPLPARGRAELDLGQVKAPISRQTLVSDAVLQMVEKADLTSLAPDRQLGARAIVNLPALPMVELSGGVFNGDGRNQIDNIDEGYLFAGRLALRPIGPTAPLVESGFGEDSVSVAASVGRNLSDFSDYSLTRTYLGVDGFASWQGASATAEYLQVRSRYTTGAPEPDSRGNGLNLQAGYLLPLPGFLYRRLEVAGRFEEIDRNDTVPIERRGDANQSLRKLTAAVSYYHFGHDLKAQVSYSHIIELEDLDRTGLDASYPNDLFLAQVSYRLNGGVR